MLDEGGITMECIRCFSSNTVGVGVEIGAGVGVGVGVGVEDGIELSLLSSLSHPSSFDSASERPGPVIVMTLGVVEEVGMEDVVDDVNVEEGGDTTLPIRPVFTGGIGIIDGSEEGVEEEE